MKVKGKDCVRVGVKKWNHGFEAKSFVLIILIPFMGGIFVNHRQFFFFFFFNPRLIVFWGGLLLTV